MKKSKGQIRREEIIQHRCGHDGQRKRVAHMPTATPTTEDSHSKLIQNHPHDFTKPFSIRLFWSLQGRLTSEGLSDFALHGVDPLFSSDPSPPPRERREAASLCSRRAALAAKEPLRHPRGDPQGRSLGRRVDAAMPEDQTDFL